MEQHLNVVGGLLVVLAALHGVFPRYFGWREEFSRVSLINRQMMYVHTLFIALAVGLMGLLCLTSAPELVQTPLGRRVSAGLAGFWLARLAVQFWGYSPALWRGKRFETGVHVLFVLLWSYISAVFGLTALSATLQ